MINKGEKLRNYLDFLIKSEKMGKELGWIFDLLTEKILYTPEEILNHYYEDVSIYHQIMYRSILDQEYEICEICRNIVRIKTINIKKLSCKKLNEEDFNEVIEGINSIELQHLHNIKNLIKDGGN